MRLSRVLYRLGTRKYCSISASNVVTLSRTSAAPPTSINSMSNINKTAQLQFSTDAKTNTLEQHLAQEAKKVSIKSRKKQKEDTGVVSSSTPELHEEETNETTETNESNETNEMEEAIKTPYTNQFDESDAIEEKKTKPITKILT